MPRVLIWDLPTRIFHWLLTAVFSISAAISITVDEDSPLFSTHIILGIVLGVMVLLRIMWGFIGTTCARFTSFLFSPISLMRYGFGALNGTEARPSDTMRDQAMPFMRCWDWYWQLRSPD